MKPATVVLVACAAGKHTIASPARDLYRSALFEKSRTWAEANGDAGWFILSAFHGVLHPDQVIPPYNMTLNTMAAEDRRRWAGYVCGQLAQRLPTGSRIVFLAGTRYREGLLSPLRGAGHLVALPLEGLRIGYQLQRLGTLRPEELRFA